MLTDSFTKFDAGSWKETAAGLEHLAERGAGVVLLRVALEEGFAWFEALTHRGRSVVTESERDRAERFHDRVDAMRHLVGRAAARATIAEVSDRKLGLVTFETDRKGKPADPEGDLEFNISHAGRWVVVAFCWNESVGVDIEQARRRVSKGRDDSLTAEVLTDRERQWRETVFRADARDEDEAGAELAARASAAFMHLWTAKEAVLKAEGEGLRWAPERLVCNVSPSDADSRVDHVARVEAEGQTSRRWAVETFAVDADHLGAVADGNSTKSVWMVEFEAWREWISADD